MKSIFAVFAIPLIALLLRVLINLAVVKSLPPDLLVMAARCFADIFTLFVFWGLLKLDLLKL